LPSLVLDISICFIAAGLLAVVFARLNIPEIAAFLVAGALVGPFGAAVVSDPHNIDTIAQLGLILLLFLVGLEIDLRKLMASGRTLIVTGLLQYPLCVVAAFAAMKLLPAGGTEAGGYAPLYAGFVVAASSTLLVVKLFQQHLQLDTQVGRVSLGLLIFQDFWVIVVIALQPNFASPDVASIAWAFAGIALLSVTAWTLARVIAPVLFNWIAKVPELMLVAAIAWCFSIVMIGLNLDALSRLVPAFGHSIAVGASMGALIAGASIANLPHSHEITGKVVSVKDFFVILFFVGLGMSIPRPEGAGVLLLALLLAAITVALRYVVFFPLLYATGLDRRSAFVSSTRLAQVSEFSLVVGFLGMQLGHIPASFGSAIIFAFVITALVTPALFNRAHAMHDRLGPVLARLGFREPAGSTGGAEENWTLALLGFHRVASSLLHELARTYPAILERTLVVDFNVAIHGRIAALGPTVRYADIGNESTLHHVGIDRATLVVCTVPDDLLKGTSNRELARIARRINPGAIIIANALDFAEAERIYQAGADYVYLSRVHTAAALAPLIEKVLSGDAGALAAATESRSTWRGRGEVIP